MARCLHFCLGWLMVVPGVIGAFVPLIPATIFLIFATWFFARSSPRFEAWLFTYPRFGPPLVAWHTDGAESRASKVSACIGMTAGFALFCIGTRPALWLALVVAAFLLASAAYVVSRPALRHAHRAGDLRCG